MRRRRLRRFQPLLASSFLTPQGHLFTRGSPTLLPRRLAACGRDTQPPGPFLPPRSTPEFTKFTPAPTPVHISQSKERSENSFPSVPCKVLCPSASRDSFSANSVFPRRRRRGMVWDAPVQICAPFLLLAPAVKLPGSPSSPQPSAPLSPLSNSQSQAMVLPIITQMIIRSVVTPRQAILTSWGECQALL